MAFIVCMSSGEMVKSKMLDYLAKKDINRYRALIAKLGIRK